MVREESSSLLRCRLFEGVERERLSELLGGAICSEREYGKGQRVDAGFSALGILLSGKLRVGGTSERKKAVLNELLPGAVFGFATLFEGDRHFESDLRAASAARVLWIGEEHLKELIAREQRIGFNVMAIQSEKIRFLNGRIRSFTASGGAEKLEGYLRSLERDGDGVLKIPLGMSPLSKRLGISRATLYRAFEKLSFSGKLKKAGKNAYIYTP